jgi:hypothetical protein
MRKLVPIDFLRRLRTPLRWDEFKYGYENGFVDGKTIIDYACGLVSEDDSQSTDVIELACARPSDSIAGLLSKIVGNESEMSSEVRKRWALILAAFVSESPEIDRLASVEEIYDALDYPSELSPFVRYMPMTGPDLGSVEANEKRMENALKDFSATIVSSVFEAAGH